MTIKQGRRLLRIRMVVPLACGASLAAGCAASGGPAPAPSPAVAAYGDPAPALPPLTAEQRTDRRESLALLRQARYDELDARMNGFQRSYRDGGLDELSLLREFAAFMAPDPTLAPALDGWAGAHPDSYAAHTARGIHRVKLALDARGTDSLRDTRPEAVQTMTVQLITAQRDLERSLGLDPRPIVSLHYLIKSGMQLGARDSTRHWLDAALALDPVSMIIRRPYMMTLETRWGGSLDQMKEFLDASHRAGVPDAGLRDLQGMIDAERNRLAPGRRPEAAAADTET